MLFNLLGPHLFKNKDHGFVYIQRNGCFYFDFTGRDKTAEVQPGTQKQSKPEFLGWNGAFKVFFCTPGTNSRCFPHRQWFPDNR